MIPKLITAEWLKKQRACRSQVVLFSAKWPHGAEPTEANLVEAPELGLDLCWLAQWLPRPLWDEFLREVAPLFAEFQRKEASLLAEYVREAEPLWTEYERQRPPLREEYERQAAPLLARLIAQAEHDRTAEDERGERKQ